MEKGGANVLNLKWNYVKGTWSSKPKAVDLTMSPSSVYLRKNITKEVEKVDDDLVTYYAYDEAVLTHEEYEEYCSLLNDPGIQKLEEDNLILMNANAEGYETSEQNNLIIMEAIADLYELLNKLTEVQ